MLGIFGKKSDHPLADIKSAQEVLNDVPKNDSLNAVQELTDWIESIVEQADNFRLDHQLAVLRMFDEAAQPHVRKLLRDYFAVQSPAKFQENRLWMVLDNFYTRSELAHHDVLTRYRNGGRGASGIKAELAVLGARGIAALNGRLKMAAARYALVEAVLWKRLADFYSHAETAGYHNDALALYPGALGMTSVKQEFAVLLAWNGVSAGTRSPLQEHIAACLIAHVGKGWSVGNQPKSDDLFVFDLAQPTAPMRAVTDFTLHPALRFVGEAEALEQLHGLLAVLDKGIVPEEINLGGAKYEAELLRDVASRLIVSLTLPPPTRRSPRRNIGVNVNVANGLANMIEQSNVGLNFNQKNSSIWEVEDISVTGYRSVVPLARAEGVKIGSLLGSKPENVRHWGAGIVRRLSRDDKNNLHVGVEVLSNQVVAVAVVDRGLSSEEGQIALYLSRPKDTSGEAWLLLQPNTFSTTRSLIMELNDKDYLLLPLSLVESGDDYDLARYRQMEQDSTDED